MQRIFDNVGLLVGNQNMVVQGILVTLDTLENVVDEAIEKKCNLIISFHPIIFKGLKKSREATMWNVWSSRQLPTTLPYIACTLPLDNSGMGVNAKICEVLNIKNPEILIPKTKTLKKLITYAPLADVDKVKSALFKAGAGNIGQYSDCSFSLEGVGSFKAGKGANPTLGEIGKVHLEKEAQVNVLFSFEKEKDILNALFEAHPYEEVAYELLTLDNVQQNMGMGMVGTLEEEMDEEAFLQMVKSK